MSDAMNSIGCNRLDDFLDHDLRGADRQTFVEHLESCAACRDAVSGLQSLAYRLRVRLERTDSTPPLLASRIKGRIRGERIQRVALTALAASVALVAVWLAVDRPRAAVDSPPIAKLASPADESPVRIRFPNRDVIAMPIASESPNVTFVMVYPELQAAVPAPLERNER
jgi:anti-sigma factor RsiW